MEGPAETPPTDREVSAPGSPPAPALEAPRPARAGAPEDASLDRRPEGAYDRTPPFSPEAEASVLGGMLVDPSSVPLVMERIRASMFYREAHRRIYRSIQRLAERSEGVDVVKVADELRGTDELESVGGLPYLSALLDAVPTAANIVWHADIVRDKAVLRGLIDAGQSIVRMAYGSEGRTPQELTDAAEQVILEVSRQERRTEWVRVKEILYPTFEKIEQLQESPGDVSGLATGFIDLDRMTTGLQPGDLVIVAGRPSMGKTSWALNVAQHAAVHADSGVGVFSLEMSKEQLVQRLLCSTARVDALRLRRGRLDAQEFQRLAGAAGHLNRAPIWIDDSATANILELRSKARRLAVENEIGLIVIDYMQLMTAPGRSDNRVQEVSVISRGLKALARELNVPVVALSQLSRAPEQRTDRRPQLSDLRESGSIEQDADLVMFLYRPEYYFGPEDKEGRSLEGKAELIVAKQRNGPTGIVQLYFQKSCTLFESATDEEEP